MRIIKTKPVRATLCTVLATAGIIFNATTASAESVSRTFTVSLPDSRPLFLSVEDENGQAQEVVNKDGARDQTVEITVTAATVSDVSTAPTASCEGTAVDQRLAFVIGGDNARIVIRRHYTPISASDGTELPPVSETVVDHPVSSPGTRRAVNICA